MRTLAERFSYHATDKTQQERMGIIRERILAAAAAVSNNTPDPEGERALEKLEEAMMIANAGIARGHPEVCQAATDVDGALVKCNLPRGHQTAHHRDGLTWE